MLVIFSLNNIPVRLTSERWEHIISRHPEMFAEKEKVVETIESPRLCSARRLWNFDCGKILQQNTAHIKTSDCYL